MGARWKVLVTAAVVACMVAVAGCASQGTPSSTSSSAGSSSSSSTTSSSSTVAPQTGSTAEIALNYNAGTGYEWTYSADPEGVVELSSQKTESLSRDKTTSGGPLQERFTFRAVKPGEVVLTFNLARSWESGAKPAETQVYAFTVTDSLQMILNPYKSDFANEPVIG